MLSIDVVIYFEMYSSFLLFGPGVRILYLRKVVFRPDQRAVAMYAKEALGGDALEADKGKAAAPSS